MAQKQEAALQTTFEKFAPLIPPRQMLSEPLLENVSCRFLQARYFVCFRNWRMAPRKLPHDMFFFVLKGRGEALIAGRKHSFHKGDCLHFRRGEIHEAKRDPAVPFHVLVLHYSAIVKFSLTLPEIMGFPDIFDFKKDSFAQGLLWETCRQSTLITDGWPQAMDALALTFLNRILIEYGNLLRPVNAERLSDIARLYTVTKSMREQIARGQSLDDYAELASMSPSHFRRIFRRTMGISPNQYMRQLRLERAAYLLRNTSDTIESIAYQVGYGEPAFFARTFKAQMGLAPGGYRKKTDLMDR